MPPSKFPVSWPHRPDYEFLVDGRGLDDSDYAEQCGKQDVMRTRGNAGFFKGLVRRCRRFAGYEWGFARDQEAVAEWLRTGASWCEEWLRADPSRPPSVAAFESVFTIGIVGGSQQVREWVATRDSTAGHSGGISGSGMAEQWGRSLIALSRGDTAWIREIADRMSVLLDDPATPPEAVEALCAIPELMRAVIGEGDIEEAVANRHETYVHQYLRGYGSDRARTPEVFIDWFALRVVAYAPEYGVRVPESLYLPVGAITTIGG